jgi:hypothetical protein
LEFEHAYILLEDFGSAGSILGMGHPENARSRCKMLVGEIALPSFGWDASALDDRLFFSGVCFYNIVSNSQMQ